MACTLHRVPLAGLPLLTIYSVPVSMLDTDLSLVGLRTHRPRLPADALPAGERAGRAVGAHARRAGPADPRLRRQRRRAAVLGRRDRRRGDRARGRRTPLMPTLASRSSTSATARAAATTSRSTTRWSTCGATSSAATTCPWSASPPTTRPRPTYGSRCSTASPTTSGAPGDRDVPGRPARRSATLPPHRRASTPRAARGVHLRRRDRRRLPLDVAAHAGTDLRDRGRRRLALRRHSRWTSSPSTTTCDAARHELLDDRGRARPRPRRAWPRRAPRRTGAAPELTDLPDALPTSVRDLATRGHGRGTDAVPRRPWRCRTGSARTAGSPTTWTARRATASTTLEAFLDERATSGRTGYCEQFAASMAVMAREPRHPRAGGRRLPGARADQRRHLGLQRPRPARLARAVLPGAGWVLFEPTPADRVPGVPTTPGSASRSPTPPTGLPSSSASRRRKGVTRPPTDAPRSRPRQGAGAALGQRLRLHVGPALVGWPSRLLLLVALALLPRFVRAAVARPAGRGAPRPSWDELRATVVDLGLTWPAERSPRETRAASCTLRPPAGTDPVRRPAPGPEQAPEAGRGAAADRLDLEQLRYARPAPDRPHPRRPTSRRVARSRPGSPGAGVRRVAPARSSTGVGWPPGSAARDRTRLDKVAARRLRRRARRTWRACSARRVGNVRRSRLRA